MTDKNLKLERVDLLVDPRIIIDAINANSFEWMIDKTLEELIELANALTHYRRAKVTDAQVCMEIGDVYLQEVILHHLFSKPLIQSFINKKLTAIDNRSQRILRKTEVGFKVNGFNNSKGK